MRSSILLWSMASGLILGLFIDATLVGVALLFSAVVPGISRRVQHRWMTLTVSTLLAVIPLIMIVLGYMEGELKTV